MLASGVLQGVGQIRSCRAVADLRAVVTPVVFGSLIRIYRMRRKWLRPESKGGEEAHMNALELMWRV